MVCLIALFVIISQSLGHITDGPVLCTTRERADGVCSPGAILFINFDTSIVQDSLHIRFSRTEISSLKIIDITLSLHNGEQCQSDY